MKNILVMSFGDFIIDKSKEKLKALLIICRLKNDSKAIIDVSYPFLINFSYYNY
jgi:hypothetical protein